MFVLWIHYIAFRQLTVTITSKLSGRCATWLESNLDLWKWTIQTSLKIRCKNFRPLTYGIHLVPHWGQFSPPIQDQLSPLTSPLTIENGKCIWIKYYMVLKESEKALSLHPGRKLLLLYTTDEMKNQTESWRSIKHLSSTKSTIQCRY